ncbi:MAG TPA: N-acetylneuraminate synthase family protein [Gaiellaceae bacterium]|nr:N-acetylneuraminate synthase family protein [Gaiellaceae bacterium]
MIEIGGRSVGPGMPCYVIAEAGVNHDGDVDRALALVHAAKDAGADAVKFQLFRADDLATATAPKARYQTETTGAGEPQAEMLRALELPDEAYVRVAEEARAAGIDFLCTPYSERDADVLAPLVPAFKVASAFIVEPLFLAHLAALGKPILLSTGMATIAEIHDALAIVRGADVILLQCTSEYPAPAADANLRVMEALEREFGVVVGFSDHTEGDAASIAAVALGACVLEKHFTLDRTLPGPDHRASLEPAELAALVRQVREVEAALGSAEKKPTAAEVENRGRMRRSLVAAVDIPAGTRLTAAHVALKRPGDGMPPRMFDDVVGASARADIPRDTQLSSDLLEP